MAVGVRLPCRTYTSNPPKGLEGWICKILIRTPDLNTCLTLNPKPETLSPEKPKVCASAPGELSITQPEVEAFRAPQLRQSNFRLRRRTFLWISPPPTVLHGYL